MRKPVYAFLIIPVLLICGWGARRQILSGAAPVAFENNPAVAATESALGSPDKSYGLVDGVDYKIEKVNYFDGNQWAVVSITPLNNASDSSLLVLKDVGRIYQVAWGPGNYLSASDTKRLPSDVADYINSGAK